MTTEAAPPKSVHPPKPSKPSSGSSWSTDKDMQGGRGGSAGSAIPGLGLYLPPRRAATESVASGPRGSQNLDGEELDEGQSMGTGRRRRASSRSRSRSRGRGGRTGDRDRDRQRRKDSRSRSRSRGRRAAVAASPPAAPPPPKLRQIGVRGAWAEFVEERTGKRLYKNVLTGAQVTEKPADYGHKISDSVNQRRLGWLANQKSEARARDIAEGMPMIRPP